MIIELTFIPHIPYDRPPAGQPGDKSVSGIDCNPMVLSPDISLGIE
jgi:hypothetical protein